MNSRIEGGECAIKTRDDFITTINEWVNDNEDIEVGEIASTYLMYYSGENYEERYITFPEFDTQQRIRNSIIFDKDVEIYIDVNNFSEFLYNCIDVNALVSLNKIVLFYDNDTENSNYDYSYSRYLLKNLTCDEYALEVGNNVLGINWVEKSIILINVSLLLETSKEIAMDDAKYYNSSISKWRQYFKDIFTEGLIQTVCHEFRHLVYECCEFVEIGGKNYPQLGGIEAEVEKYGNDVAFKLINNKMGKKYIEAMIKV